MCSDDCVLSAVRLPRLMPSCPRSPGGSTGSGSRPSRRAWSGTGMPRRRTSASRWNCSPVTPTHCRVPTPTSPPFRSSSFSSKTAVRRGSWSASVSPDCWCSVVCSVVGKSRGLFHFISFVSSHLVVDCFTFLKCDCLLGDGFGPVATARYSRYEDHWAPSRADYCTVPVRSLDIQWENVFNRYCK